MLKLPVKTSNSIDEETWNSYKKVTFQIMSAVSVTKIGETQPAF